MIPIYLIPPLDGLQLVELGRLILHEAHDDERLDRVRARIEAEGIQRDPIIVSSFGEDFLVLDGAHRVHALEGLGSRLALVQVVEPPASAESWSHLVGEAGIEGLRDAEGVEISEGEPRDGWLAEVETAGGTRFSLRSRDRGLPAEVRVLWEMQETYPREGEIRRVGSDEPVGLAGAEAIVRYRTFTPEELVEVVRCGAVLPAGITRFRVEERVLGVRFPLRTLRSEDAAAANADLRGFVEERWRENRIRRYSEPVVLFE